jgi:hypothetical protein
MDTRHRRLKLVATGVMILVFVACTRLADAAVSWGPPYEGASNYEVLFDKFNVVNPTYTFDDDPTYGSVTVSFGTQFAGQTLGTSYNSLSSSAATGPLSFAAGQPDVMTQFDLRRPNTIRLGGVEGTARYTTPIAILFDHPVSQVGFTLGFLDELPPSARIEAFEASGASLGVLTGIPHGFTALGVVESTGDRISGVSIYLPDGSIDEEGFGIDALTFSIGGVVPEPATFFIWSLLGLATFSAVWYSRRGLA